jgi:hypothetical protein
MPVIISEYDRLWDELNGPADIGVQIRWQPDAPVARWPRYSRRTDRRPGKGRRSVCMWRRCFPNGWPSIVQGSGRKRLLATQLQSRIACKKFDFPVLFSPMMQVVDSAIGTSRSSNDRKFLMTTRLKRIWHLPEISCCLFTRDNGGTEQVLFQLTMSLAVCARSNGSSFRGATFVSKGIRTPCDFATIGLAYLLMSAIHFLYSARRPFADRALFASARRRRKASRPFG